MRRHVEALIALAREKPDDLGSGFGEPAETPRHALGGVVTWLDDESCAPAVAQDARAAYDALP
jgi:hypothetical protein